MKGHKVLGHVEGSSGDSNDRRFVVWISEYLTGWTWVIVVLVICWETRVSVRKIRVKTVVTPGVGPGGRWGRCRFVVKSEVIISVVFGGSFSVCGDYRSGIL